VSGNDNHCSYPRLTSWRLWETVMGGGGSFVFSFVFSFVISLVRTTSSWDRPGRGTKGSYQHAATARTADWKRTTHNLPMIWIGRI